MPTLIYTNQRGKLSKKQRAAREALLKEQRAIKKELKEMRSASKPVFVDPVSHRRDTPAIPSLDTGIGVAVKRESPVYTGTEMIGIGQLHKSNAVPVFRQEDAQDLARMRR